MMPASFDEPRPFALLRGLMRKKMPTERCELCSAELGPEHPHLVEPETRRLLCSCTACALLFSDAHSRRYRRVPRDVRLLADVHMTDAQWEDLRIPINLAFFFHSTPAKHVVAMYPSPAGATESLLALEAWRGLSAANPVLQELEPDVEALLVNRLGPVREYYRVPIDECYRLVGIIRRDWRGLSGGAEVWQTIAGFLAVLKEKSVGTGGGSHA